jgi:hypothetical protein
MRPLPTDIMDTSIQLVQKLGLTPAPLVLAGAREVVGFFETHLHTNPMSWLEYIKGIDFHKSVRQVSLLPGRRLIRHSSTAPPRAKPFAYFADVGASPTRLGTTFPSTAYEEKIVPYMMRALECFASSLNFGRDPSTGRFDPVSRAGGAKQYILADRDARGLRDR